MQWSEKQLEEYEKKRGIKKEKKKQKTSRTICYICNKYIFADDSVSGYPQKAHLMCAIKQPKV